MTDRPDLSKGEMDVARILWQIGKASVRDVHAALSAEKGIDFKTVQTYLRRLEAKGYVRATMEGRQRIYHPRAKPASVIKKTVRDLVDRLFGGQAMPLMRHLIEDGDISKAEIDQLRKLINRIESQQDSSSNRRKEAQL